MANLMVRQIILNLESIPLFHFEIPASRVEKSTGNLLMIAEFRLATT
jgi:hypothetical protein